MAIIPNTPRLGKETESSNEGAPGKSAYEIAVANGYEGSVTEWLASLKGDAGNDGQAGKDGVDGLPGKDGNPGNDGLNGKDGEPGESGSDGAPGKDGSDGKNGNDGQNGLDGKSSYELAVAAGYPGTLSQWLTSLKGADGSNGKDGSNGVNGKSAYEIAVAAGYQGTLAQWLLSLKGIDGSNGKDGVNGVNGKDGANGKDGSNGTNGKDGLSLTPAQPSAITVALDTAYQPSTSKPVNISVMIEAVYVVTLAAALTDVVELWIGPDDTVKAATTAQPGTARKFASFSAGLTGIAVSIGMSTTHRNQLFGMVPAGYYFAVRKISGTRAVVKEAFSQALT